MRMSTVSTRRVSASRSQRAPLICRAERQNNATTSVIGAGLAATIAVQSLLFAPAAMSILNDDGKIDMPEPVSIGVSPPVAKGNQGNIGRIQDQGINEIMEQRTQPGSKSDKLDGNELRGPLFRTQFGDQAEEISQRAKDKLRANAPPSPIDNSEKEVGLLDRLKSGSLAPVLGVNPSPEPLQRNVN